MKKIIVFVITIFLWRCYAGAQEITIAGIICDEVTKLPISDVYVYLDGTTIQTMTNTSGRFALKPTSVINTKLVISYLSYETIIIDHPFEELPDTLYMQEQIQSLNEVVVAVDRFSRRQKMAAFREQFLGLTPAGKACTIMNSDNSRIKQRRDNVYQSSTNYFFKCFANNVLKDNQFKMFHKGILVNHQDYFSMKDTLSHKMISIIPDTDINNWNEELFTFLFGIDAREKNQGMFSVLHRNVQTDIYFETDSFLVDRYGNIDQIDKIVFMGQMGDNRVGDMLPIDYE